MICKYTLFRTLPLLTLIIFVYTFIYSHVDVWQIINSLLIGKNAALKPNLKKLELHFKSIGMSMRDEKKILQLCILSVHPCHFLWAV